MPEKGNLLPNGLLGARAAFGVDAFPSAQMSEQAPAEFDRGLPLLGLGNTLAPAMHHAALDIDPAASCVCVPLAIENGLVTRSGIEAQDNESGGMAIDLIG